MNSQSKDWVGSVLNQMTIEEKVGHLLMVAFFNMGEDAVPGIIHKINEYHLGGIFHFGNTIAGLSSALIKIQDAVKRPVLVGTDFEIGPGWVISDAPVTPRPMVRGYTGDTESEYKIAGIIARMGKALGVHLTFSPVVDLNTNRANPDVNIRAYGEDIDTVCRLAVPHVKGLQDNGMLAGIKHFPGNGSTDMDQHISPAIISLSKQEMESTCLEVYRRVFKESDPACVMVGHLEVPSLVTEVNPNNGRPVPASLSSELLTGILRNELGYDGLAISDAMNMGGVSAHYNGGEAAVRAIKAGLDMLLLFNPDTFMGEYNAILNAAKSGEIPMERIDKAVGRVLTAKWKAGLSQVKTEALTAQELYEPFNPEIYDELFNAVQLKGITVLRNNGDLLPVKDICGKNVLVISTFNPDKDTLNVQNQLSQLMTDHTPELLRERGAVVDTVEMKLHMGYGEMDDVLAKCSQADYIFFNFFIIPTWAIGSLIPNKSALRLFMYGLLTMNKHLIITAFGDPYVMHYCQTAPVYLCTYDESKRAQEAAVRVWLGEVNVTGRSPISLPGIYKIGDGISF